MQRIKMELMSYFSCYGTTKIPKDVCPDCERSAFIIDGEFACCGLKAAKEEPRGYKRECETDQNRKQGPPAAMKKLILAAQDGRCFYCERILGFKYRHHGKRVKLKLHWDHLVPYSYLQANDTNNFVAACHICNAVKGSMMFQTIEEARVYVNVRLQEWGDIGEFDALEELEQEEL